MRYLALFCFAFIGPLAQAQVFMPPVENAASMGMGGATTGWANMDNAWANPAQLGYAPGMGIFASSALPYSIKGWSANGLQAVAQVQKWGGFGLEVLHSGIEGYAEQRFQLGYGRQLSPRWAIGGGVQAMRVTASEYGSHQTVSAAVGVVAKPLEQLSVGAVLQNPLPQKIDQYTVANWLRIGAAWQPSETFVLSGEVTKDLARPVQVRTGVEYRPNQFLRLRVGVRGRPARTAIGAGVVFKNGLRLDFATEWHPVLGLTPGLMLAWTK